VARTDGTFRAPRSLRSLVRVEACLNPIPGRRVDDADGVDRLGDVLCDGTRNPPPGALAGNAEPLVSVPSDEAGVALVREHRPDGRVSPSSKTLIPPTAIVWCWRGRAVQLVGDLAWRLPRREGREDLPDDRRLGLIDDGDPPRVFRIRRAWLLDGAIAEGPAARVKAGQRAALEASVGLSSDGLQVLIGEQSLDAEEQARRVLVGRAAGLDVYDANVRGGKVLEDDAPGIAEVARQSREIVDEDDVELSLRGVAQELLKLRALHVGAGLGGVGVDLGDEEVLARGELATAPVLIFDRPRVLTICAEPAVRDGSHGRTLAHFASRTQESSFAGSAENCS
jgi:hypothetical protein